MCLWELSRAQCDLLRGSAVSVHMSYILLSYDVLRGASKPRLEKDMKAVFARE